MADCVCMMLHDTAIMEGRPWGPEKIQRFADRLGDVFDEYFEALEGGAEADVYQDRMDRALRSAVGDRFVPFKARYPEIRETVYGSRRRK